MPHLNLTLLGAFQAQLDHQPLTTFHSTKVQGLLAYLAVEAARPHTREALMALLWPDDAPQSAQQSLRQALYALRRTLGDTDNPAREPFLLVTRQTIQVNPRSQVTLDVTTFLQQVQQGNLAQAVALYPADLLAGMSTDSAPFEEWLRATREYLHQLALNALDQVTQQRLATSDYAGAVTYARRQLTLEPWREEAHRQVMMALALSGERSAALAQYESCRRALAEELEVDPTEETSALYTQIRAGQLRAQTGTPHPLTVSPKLRAEAARPATRHNLPPQPTPFIGRQTDLAQITTRLDDPACRLLTIVGPGGMGKTRLAIQAAQNMGELVSSADTPLFIDGICFVALAGVASPDLLVATMTTALALTFYGSADLKTHLLNHLKTRSVLLVLDNCEHLLAGIDLISDLLAATPNVKVLATSREPLNLREEWLHPLGSMSFPGDTDSTVREPDTELAEYTAIQLFTQCAQRMKPGFTPDDEGTAVVRICQLVNGMPLGIEMATSWLKHFSCGQIAIEVERNLDFLATNLRNVPARHRSIRALFEHSWSLLSPSERQVLQRLAVFRGGFRLAAAQQVAEASFALLMSLAEKSLVQPTLTDRYQMHDLLRQFAAEKLQALPHEWAKTQERHGHYYLEFLQQHTGGLEGRRSTVTVTAIEEEVENIRLALYWALRHQKVDEIELGLTGLHLFFWMKQWYQEGEALLAQTSSVLAMEKPAGKQGVLWGRCLAMEAHLLDLLIVEVGQLRSSQQVLSLCQQSLAILYELNAHDETGLTLRCLGRCYRIMGEFTLAQLYYKQALVVLAAQSNSIWLRGVIHDLGFIYFTLGDYDNALDYFQQCIARCEAINDLKTLGDALNMVGEVYRVQGDYAVARQTAQAALTARTTVDDKRGIAWSLQLLGEIAWHVEDYATAQQYSSESLTLFNTIGLTREGHSALNILGNTALSLNDYGEARRYFCAVLTPLLETRQVSLRWIDIIAITGLAIVVSKEGQPTSAVQLLTYTHRHPAGLQETKERAAARLAELAALLSPEQFTAAQQRAETQDLFTFVTELL